MCTVFVCFIKYYSNVLNYTNMRVIIISMILIFTLFFQQIAIGHMHCTVYLFLVGINVFIINKIIFFINLVQ